MWYIQFSFAYTILLILNQFSIHQAFVSIQLLSNRLYQRKQLYAETSTFQQRNALQNNKNNKTAGSNGRLPLPFMELSSVGLIGRWQERAGNYILKPKSSSKPLGVIHFLGGN